MISLSNVSKIFTTGATPVTAVDQVSLEIARGDIFGIIGYSGAGKSTLIRMLNGLERPGSGSVVVNGADLGAASEAELRRLRPGIGMIFQHFNLLWSRTVAENIALPMQIAGASREAIDARVAVLVGLVGLEGREAAYPSQLSGGQKQRVGIARALANQPQVLLCDEATSALDPETTDQILDLLAEINTRLGLTIVLITHEMHVVRRICNRVAVMEAGRIAETGPVSTVFSDPQQPVTQRFLRQLSDAGESRELQLQLAPGALPDLGGLVRLHGVAITLLAVTERAEGGQDWSLRLTGDATAMDGLTDALRAAGFGVEKG